MCCKVVIWLKVLLRQASENTMISRFLKPTIIIVMTILISGNCEWPAEPEGASYREYNICGAINPDWFMELIEEAESDPYYLSAIYQHEYGGSYLFHFDSGISSCMYCRIYDCEGHLKEWASQEEFEDYLNNRQDEQVIWHWHE